MNLQRTDGRPLVIGHRGAARLAPENTLRALEAAVAARADLVEFDVGPDLTLAHSPFERPAEELSLDAALEYLASTQVGVHLDVKEPGYEAAIVASVRRHGLEERAIASSSYPVTTRRLAAIAPWLPRVIGYPRDRYGISRFAWPRPAQRLGAAALRQAMPVRVPFLLRSARAGMLALHRSLCSRAAVAAAHRLGAPVLVWTVNDESEVARFAAIGVDAVVSDDPEMAMATLSRP